MLINTYQSQNGTFIVVFLLPLAFSHPIWLLRQQLKYDAYSSLYLISMFARKRVEVTSDAKAEAS